MKIKLQHFIIISLIFGIVSDFNSYFFILTQNYIDLLRGIIIIGFLLITLKGLKRFKIDVSLLLFLGLGLIFTKNFEVVPIIKLILFVIQLIVLQNILYSLRINSISSIINTFTISICLISITIGLIIPEIGYRVPGRINGVFANPNGLSLFAVFSLVFLEYNRKDLNSKILLMFRFVLISTIILTGSRNGFFSSIIFYFLSNIKNLKNALIIIPILSFLLVLTTNYFYDIIKYLNLNDFLRIYDANDLAEASGRKFAHAFGFNEFSNNSELSKFIGNGPEYTNKFYLLNEKRLSILGHEGNAHHSILTLLLDYGYIGTFTFLYHLVRLTVKKNFELINIVGIGLLMGLNESFIGISFSAPTLLFFLTFYTACKKIKRT